jgi:hypothetical protein
MSDLTDQTDLIDQGDRVDGAGEGSSSDYRVTIMGPDGLALAMTMDARLRLVRSLVIEDARLREMLIVSSVVAGQVEGVCLRMLGPNGGSESPSLMVSQSSTEGRAEP